MPDESEVAGDILAMMRGKKAQDAAKPANLDRVFEDVAKPGLDTSVWQWRRKWLATAHLLGASFTMLAKMEGRSKQAVLQAVEKEVPVTVRASQRLFHTLDFTALSWYYEKFYANREQISLGMEPRKMAEWLIANHKYQGD